MATPAEPRRIVNDSVHGSIQLDPLLVMIIDTPQFQRLRDIKQLGVCYWVYPGASHNRFEHCIGSSYICSEMINSLRSATQANGNDTEELITDYESLCLRIAALCRDLGYGPFSHFFHNVLVPKLMRAQTSSSDRNINWARDASCKMFDFMLKENPTLKEALCKKLNPGADGDKDWQRFIKDLIHGKDSKDVKERCSFEGSDNLKKSFLYEIVSNKRTRIDCNKFDYISRDCHNVGIKSDFDWRRYLLNIRIKKVRGSAGEELQIHARDKDYFNLNNLFYTRWSLYYSVYRHKTIAGIEDMLSEAILKVDKKLEISSLIKKDDSLLNEKDESMKRYTKLTDRIFYQILEFEEQSEQATGSSAQERSQSEEAFGVHAQESSQSEKVTGSSPQERSQSEQTTGSSAQATRSSPQERSQSEQATGSSAQERSQSEQATGSSLQEHSQSEQLKEAKKLLQNIQQRKLYKYCGQAKLKDPFIKKDNKKKAFAKEVADKCNGEEEVSEDDVFISFAYFHWGKEDKNPIDDVPFFTKLCQQQYYLTEGTFHECYMRVYAKLPAQKKEVTKAFQEWCNSNPDEVISPKLNDSSASTQDSNKQD